jgi:acyl carrier protein
MNKKKFLLEIQDIMLLEEINETTGIEVDSMASLLLIAFLDEEFSISISHEQIKSIKSVSDIIKIVGKDNLN